MKTSSPKSTKEKAHFGLGFVRDLLMYRNAGLHGEDFLLSAFK